MPLPQAPSSNGSDVATSAASEPITVTPLGGPEIDAVGLLPVSVTGLPDDLWGDSSSADLARLIRAEPVETLPAALSLLYTLLLAELDAPVDADRTGTVFLARIDKLLDLGALDQAQALLERAGPDTPDLFRRWFDVALLTGTEDAACETLRTKADIAPTFAARIFCLARNGDWKTAALTLGTAEALGYVTKEEDALLARFLDPGLFEGDPPLPPPAQVTPLIFRMLEAIGEPLPTAPLPRAFAQADLRSTAGWKAQIEAAERLARTGAIAETRLLAIYTARRPAASGGVWDRVAAVQNFDAAIGARDGDAVARTLQPVWKAMKSVQLEVPFARLYADALARLNLNGPSGALAYRIGLLSPAYEEIARRHAALDASEGFLSAAARGDMQTSNPDSALTRAIRNGFTQSEMPAAFTPLVADNRLGEALLKMPTLLRSGSEGDLQDLANALTLMRLVGLEDTARQAALEVMLLGRRD